MDSVDPFAVEPCCLTGPEHGQPVCEHWRSFEHLYLLAGLRWELERLALRCEARMRRENLSVSAHDLALLMARELAHTPPRSRIVPWHLDDAIVDAAIVRVARAIVSELYPTC